MMIVDYILFDLSFPVHVYARHILYYGIYPFEDFDLVCRCVEKGIRGFKFPPHLY